VNGAANGPGMVSISFLSGPLAGKTYSITRPVTTIGRGTNNDIVIENDLKVSRNHARLVYNNGMWTIEKVAPQNIVTVNQQKVEQAVIQDNMMIGLGDNTTFRFQVRVETPQRVGPVSSPGNPPSQPFPPQPSQPMPMQPPPGGTPPNMFSPQQAPLSYTSPLQGSMMAAPGETVIARPQTTAGIATIEVSSNIHGLRQSFPLDKPVINIGRDVTNDIVINDRIVSGRHLQIVRQGSQYFIVHPHPDRQHTLNGLLYQGRKIRGDEQYRQPLRRGDIYRIGDENGTLITLTYNDGTGIQEEMVPPVQPIRLDMPELTIGRRPDNMLVLNHPQVSGHHARLVRDPSGYRIYDLNSTNHVYVNSEIASNQLLKTGDEIRIGPYRLIYEGNQLTQYDESNFIRIDALHLKKFGNNNVTLLNDITIAVPPRKFVALVGGSGAGKSTLMDALNGLRPAQQGEVLYNGQDYYKNLAAFSTQLGYVPQDDIVHRDLTVERALYYAAKLRLPSDYTEEQIEQRIKEVLDEVDLTRRRKLLIKKLSGGQRKRVSIALELLANPSVFFLDEPTSGLDPGLDRKMMFLLRNLADRGHTIVLVTHATNNINSCDYVCFLCSGGKLAYFGPPEQAKTYFGKTDFAEIYSSLEPTEENPNIPDEAEARFRASQEYQQYVVTPLREGPAGGSQGGAKAVPQQLKRPKRGNPFKQFALLSRRNLELLFNDRANLVILLLQAPLIALLLMLLIRSQVGAGVFDANNVVQCMPKITTTLVQAPGGVIGLNTTSNSLVDCNQIKTFLKNDAQGQQYVKAKGNDLNSALQDFIGLGNSINALRALFIVAFVSVLFGCINGTRAIVKEASIYRRERTVNLGIAPYILSKIAVLGVLSLIQSAFLLLITELFEPLHQGIFLPSLLEVYITLALVGLSGLLVGLAASAFAGNEDSANSLLPFLLIPQLVFAGVEIPLKNLPLQIPALIFPMRWAMVALGTSIGLHSDKVGGDTLLNSDPTFHGTLFSIYSQTDAMHRLLLAWGVLVGLMILLSVLMGIGLKRKDIRA
jgi:ABC transport system ATP-binding/permease protein